MTGDRLLVLLDERPVAVLTRGESTTDLTLQYLDEYVREGQIALSASLPIRSEPHDRRRVLPYLAGLLPENSETRTEWANRLDTTSDDRFRLLAGMGWDCPGAVQFCAEDALDDLRARRSDLVAVTDDELAQRIRDLRGGSASWSLEGEHWSLGGQQEKFALAKVGDQWFEARGSAPTTHIIKPGIARLHHQALVEHITMAAARSLDVDVAESDFAQFDDQWALVSTRFDRVTLEDRVARIHQEDLAQASGRMPEHKYESNDGPTLRRLAEVIRKESRDVGDDMIALADFAAINYAAGAPDGHSKNIALLRQPTPHVAPLYDVATAMAYDAKDVDRKVALSIGGERELDRIRRHQWMLAANVLGIDGEAILQRVIMLVDEFPAAFASALEALPKDTPGADELAERSARSLDDHRARLLKRLEV